MAIVGALGLMGTMSINVLERKREIGVMRAIGASDSAVLRIFVVEGVIIGLLSWMGGILISQPMSRLISRQVGMAFLELPLAFSIQLAWSPVLVAHRPNYLRDGQPPTGLQRGAAQRARNNRL